MAGALWQWGEGGRGRVRVTRTDRGQGSGFLHLEPGRPSARARHDCIQARLLRLDDVNVVDVEWFARLIVVTVVLKRRRLICPHCAFKTSARYDRRDRASRWRHLDLGVWQVEIRATLRRLRCPTHGVVVEQVPFARPGAHLTRDFDERMSRGLLKSGGDPGVLRRV